MFSIICVPNDGLIEYRLAGFLSVREAIELDVQTRAQAAKMVAARGSYLTLTDVTEFAIQSRETVEIIKAMLSDIPRPLRSAIVAGRSPARLQANRVKPHDAMIFDTRAEAFEWLLGLSEPRLTAASY